MKNFDENDLRRRFWKGELSEKEEHQFKSINYTQSDDLLTKAYFTYSFNEYEAPKDLENNILSAIQTKQKSRLMHLIKEGSIAATILALLTLSTIVIKHSHDETRRAQFTELEKTLSSLSNQIANESEPSVFYEDNSVIIVLE